jgi:predicted DNA-binding WGR domain protein
MWRFYRMEIWPDLLGGALLMRQWGRIGTEGRRRLDPYPDVGAALNALAAIERAKRKRGYVDRRGQDTGSFLYANGTELKVPGGYGEREVRS